MAKKDFKNEVKQGIDGIISSTNNNIRETTDTSNINKNNIDSYIGLYVKVKAETHQKLKIRSVMKQINMKDLINKILEEYLKKNQE